MVRRTLLVALLITFGLLTSASVALADMGPKPTITLRILLDGQPLSDTQMQVQLLGCVVPGDPQAIWSGPPIPGLERLDLADPAGCVWQGSKRRTCHGGTIVFSGWLPRPFRVAVYLPGQDRIYLTDAADSQVMHKRYAVELAADGTGHLRPDPLPVIGRAWSLTGMLVALAVTLAIELLVIVAYTRLSHIPPGRLMAVGLVANILSLPCVWYLAGQGYQWGGPEGGVIVLAFAEGLAWLVEARFYHLYGRLSTGQALLLSMAANAASLLIGMVVH